MGMGRHFILAKLWFIIVSSMVVLIVEVDGHGRRRHCLKEERKGLLELKAFIRSSSSPDAFEFDAEHLLPSWVDNPESDCCHWERVTCNSTTGHVIELSLDNIIRKFGVREDRYNYYEYRWSLNISLFQPFKELTSLNLSSSLLSGFIQEKGSENLLRLERLETLDLASNFLNQSNLQYLSALTSLKKLNFSDNELVRSFPTQELSAFQNLELLNLSYNQLTSNPTVQGSSSLLRLRKLETLDLTYNSLSKNIVQNLRLLTSLKRLILSVNSFEGSFPTRELSVFQDLEILDLSWNSLNGSLELQDFTALQKLKILDLSENLFHGTVSPSISAALPLSLNGTFPIPGLCGLRRIEIIDLGSNLFKGTLPPCLKNLTSLRLLDLSRNNISGSLSSELRPIPISIEYIDLSYNQFEGSFFLSSLVSFPKLGVFILTGADNNKLQVDAGIEEHWDPSFQLEALVLSNCHLTNLPNFLPTQYNLRLLDLSHNKLKGAFPNWLLENNSKLEVLILWNNSFSGHLDLPSHPLENTISIDLSDNQIGGLLPEDLGNILPNLKNLILSNNSLKGVVPSSIGESRNLQLLDLSFNDFSGEVPVELVTRCTKLETLILSNNKLSGQLFSSHFNLSRLTWLDLKDNQFTGSLSNVQLESSLEILNIESNKMAGNLPNWISNVSVLNLRNNSFDGHFPCEGLLSAYYLDVSHNHLSGALPSCFDPNRMRHINFEGNKLKGSIRSSLFSLSNLFTLNLRDNELSGSIPSTISTLSNLGVLLLGKNQFSGLIPKHLCQLRSISIMDLASNSLSGPLPSCLHNISFGVRSNHEEIIFEYRFGSSGSPSVQLYRTESFFHRYGYQVYGESSTKEQVEVDFITKNRLSPYKGGILNYMSGLDVSCNNLTGRIPPSLGKLSQIHALNLSHNQLIGSIPKSFSSLSQIESLDLSYNTLSGEIPPGLINLNFLEVFSVAHNNLSSRIPDMKGQFGTFDSSSYDGNPFLCGQPLEKKCSSVVNTTDEAPARTSSIETEREGKWDEVDFVVFSASFATTYTIVLLTIAAILFINPYWQRRWFNFIEDFIWSCYYFFWDTLRKVKANFGK